MNKDIFQYLSSLSSSNNHDSARFTDPIRKSITRKVILNYTQLVAIEAAVMFFLDDQSSQPSTEDG